MQEKIIERIAAAMNLPLAGVRQTVALLDEGNTVPFIARYRKELTGGLSDEQIRTLSEKLSTYRHLEQKRADVLRLIEAQGALTSELQLAIEKAATVTELDDLYRPYRPKKRTRATVAREKGLEPLAMYILAGGADPDQEAQRYVSAEKDVASAAEALRGSGDIIAEMVADDAAVRQALRQYYLKRGEVHVRKKGEGEVLTYDDYTDYREPLAKIKPHRVLAINRGVREKILDFKIEVEEDAALEIAGSSRLRDDLPERCRELIQAAVADGYRRLLHPSLEREVWNRLLEEAVSGAMGVFKENLRKRLLVPPIPRRRVLGWDPGFRTGCKLACVSETGELLETATIYPTPPHNEREKAADVVLKLLEKYDIDCIAIGNGTASRESEEFVSALIDKHNLDVEYTIVNEAGASVYSASPLGAKEFPGLDVAERSAVSIARRLQDPLAELVKIDPRSIGVGQYQHDMPQKELGEALAGTVESCVNEVGVDLNTASAPLLSYVAGINRTVAENIVEYRNLKGRFDSREELLSISGLGPKVFKQCAGFLRIPDSPEYLDRTAVHPESYPLARRLLEVLSIDPRQLGSADVMPALSKEEIAALARDLQAGEPTVADILAEFRKPGRDPREDLPRPVFLKTVTNLEDLKPGMVVRGIVRNIVDFGAFVDIGVHQDGLVHISEIADRFIRHPLEVLKPEEEVQVKILGIDLQRRRISLSIKQA